MRPNLGRSSDLAGRDRTWDRTRAATRVAAPPREGRGMTGNTGVRVLRGINHLALVCSDMARTVDFYSGVLGMPLIKTIELPGELGQHFFFDCGGGDSLAFFWFPAAPAAQPGISAPSARPDRGDLTSAVSSMNHVAFSAPRTRSSCTATGCVSEASTARRSRITTTVRRG